MSRVLATAVGGCLVLAASMAACSPAVERAREERAPVPPPPRSAPIVASAATVSPAAVAKPAAPVATPPQPVAPLPGVQVDRLTCDGGVRVQADYYRTPEGLSFLVLHWRGKTYGLAQALSASGARYVGMLGATPGKGLEWWGKGDHATLSEVDSNDVDDSRVLLECDSVRAR